MKVAESWTKEETNFQTTNDLKDSELELPDGFDFYPDNRTFVFEHPKEPVSYVFKVNG
jgi:hypothetical protein